MNAGHHKRYIVIVCSLFLAGLMLFLHHKTAAAAICDSNTSLWCISPRNDRSLAALRNATIPKIATPLWMNQTDSPQTKTVAYSVSSRGKMPKQNTLEDFRGIVGATLHDSRGWAALGVNFQAQDSGGEFTIFLSEDREMATFSDTCKGLPSCSSGKAIIINASMWQNSTNAWTQNGGDIESYRQMIINHEIGHWLGHGHRQCGGVGQPAPLMQPQTDGLNGCTVNPWPLAEEMYSPTLEIRS